MDGTFWLALVGAASWLPQIISWFYSWIAKPRLRFVPEDKTEIGFTSLGPIFNQSFAISTSRKDALIERITLAIVHESGAKHDFYWKFLDERGAEITSTTGDRAEFRKNQPAIALKISVLGLTEKKIGFQDLFYQNKLTSCFRPAQEREIYLEKTKVANYQQETIKTKEFLDMLDFIKSGFYWIEGKYDVYLRVYETSLRKPHIEHYKFELSKNDIGRMEKNIEITQESLKDLVLYKGKDLKEWPQRFYNWVNPSFYRAK